MWAESAVISDLQGACAMTATPGEWNNRFRRQQHNKYVSDANHAQCECIDDLICKTLSIVAACSFNQCFCANFIRIRTSGSFTV